MGHAPGCLDLWGHGAAAILAQRAVRFPDAECDVAGVDQRQGLVVEPHGLGSNAHFDRLICWKPSATGTGWQAPAWLGAPPPLPGSGCGCDRGIRLAGTALARPSVHAMRARCQCLGGLRTWSATVAQSAVGPLNTSSGRHLHVQPSMSPCAYPTPGIPPFITRRSHRQDEWKIVTA